MSKLGEKKGEKSNLTAHLTKRILGAEKNPASFMGKNNRAGKDGEELGFLEKKR